jgi:hypothetical protein
MDFNFDVQPEPESETRINMTSVLVPNSEASESSETIDDWSNDVEHILEEINHNCGIMSSHHKQAYLFLVGQLIYFRLPLIVMSSANSILAIGLSSFVESQTTVSGINSLISLLCAIISSVELFLQIQKRSETELLSHREYYLLGIKISSMVKLQRKHRQVEGLTFLNSVMSDYTSLFESSNVDRVDIQDKLIVINTAVTNGKYKGFNPLQSPRFK